MAEMFGFDAPEESLTPEERRARFFAGAAPPVAPAPRPMEINRPTDVTPGIGRARAETAQSAADQAMQPTAAAPAPIGIRPPPTPSEQLRQQGPPKLGGWRKGLDIASQALSASPLVAGVAGAVPGSTLNYQKRLGEAEAGETKQLGMRKAAADIGDVESQSELRRAQTEAARTPKPQKPESMTQAEADAVANLVASGANEVEAIRQVSAASQKPTADKNLQEVRNIVGPDGKPHAYGYDTSGKRVSDYGVIADKPQTEPGNYTPVTNARGETVGWVDVKSNTFKPVGVIAGVSQAATGVTPTPGGPAAPLPLKPSGQTESRMQQGEAIQRAGEGLISSIQNNRGKLGNWQNYWKQLVSGSPISDPALSGLQSELASFAALQPAAHGARGLQAIQAFEKIIGGIPKDPDALISSIQAIQKTMAALQPPTAPAQTPPREPSPGMEWRRNKRTGEFKEFPVTQ